MIWDSTKSSYKWIVLVGCFLVYMFDCLEVTVLSFVLPALSEEFAITPVTAGVLVTATLIGMGFSGPVIGFVADNMGRKFALLTCLVVFVVLTAGIYLAPSVWIIMVMRFLAGVGLGGVWGVLAAYITETWPARHRGKAIGVVMAAFPFGGALAAQLSTLLLPNWRLLFLVAGISAFIPLVVVLVLFRESEVWKQDRHNRSEQGKTEAAGFGELFRDGRARLTVIASIVCSFAMVGFYGSNSWFPTYLAVERDFSQAEIGNHITVMSMASVVGYFVFGYLSDYLGGKRAILVSLIGSGTMLFLYGFSTDKTLLWLVGPLFCFCMVLPGIYAPYISSLYPARIRTTGAGFTYNIGRGISAFGPLVVGAIAEVFSFSVGIMIFGVLFAFATAFMLMMPSVGKPVEKQPVVKDKEEAVAA